MNNTERKNFDDYCRDFIKDELPVHEGRNVYACDLGCYLTESINCDGTATYSTAEAKDYIREWWDEAGEYWDYEKFNFGEHYHNPFDEPEAFMVCMIIEGVNSILSQCDFIDDHWDDEIVLNKKNIKTILSQAKSKSVSW